MATTADARGVEFTVTVPEAVTHFDATVNAYLRFGKDTGDHLKRALSADPDFVMGHCLKGYFFALFSNPALDQRARGVAAKARSLAAAVGATYRERLHLDALESWLAADLVGCLDRLERILVEHPRDMVALKLTTFLHFYLGDSVQLRDTVARVMHAYDEMVPGFSYVLGMHAFGLEETGRYDQAAETARRALHLEPDDPWAIHAMAHVLEMQDRAAEGVAWLEAMQPHFSGCNNFSYHVWWHLALFQLELGRLDRVLELYDEKIRADLSDEYLDICNAVSLLWRCQQRGIDIGQRYEELAARCESRIDEHLLVFADLHYLMALGGGGRLETMQRMVDSLQRFGATGKGAQATVSHDVAAAIARGVAAWYRNAPDEVVEALAPVRGRAIRIGGSHAQRDLFDQMLIDAALRCGRFPLARNLASERIRSRASNAWSWHRLADALEGCADTVAASAARERADGVARAGALA